MQYSLELFISWLPVTLACILAAVFIGFLRKKWPFITVILYTLWVMIVFTPAIFFICMCLGNKDGIALNEIGQMLPEIYTNFWPYWIVCVAVLITEIMLLAVPVKIVKQRPVAQRSIRSTAIAASLLLSLLILGGILSILAAIFDDDLLEQGTFWLGLAFLLLNWITWSIIFWRFSRHSDPHSHIKRIIKWLLRGTILELLVAIPSHIIIRHKNVCCAHGITALGIATGLAVMLISFGPGLYFLYSEKIKSKKPKE